MNTAHLVVGTDFTPVDASIVSRTVVIEQRTKYDAQLCCLAMFLRCSYEQAVMMLGDIAQAMRLGDARTNKLKQALNELGYRADADYLSLHVSPAWCTQSFLRSVLWGRRAIIDLRSKQHADLVHTIYWNGETLFDPAPEDYQYTSWAEIEAIDVIIFKEAPSKA